MFQSVTTSSASSKFHAAMHGLVLALLASVLLGYAVRAVGLLVASRDVNIAPAGKAPAPVPAQVPIAALSR